MCAQMQLETLNCDSHVQNGEAVASSCLLSHDTCLLGEDVYPEHPENHCVLFRIHLLLSSPNTIN